MRIFSQILSALFPDQCVGCKKRGSLLCSQCLRKIPPAPSPPHAFIIAAFAYRDPRVRVLVKKLKYKNTRHAAEVLAPAMAEALTEILGEDGLFLPATNVLLVPVPLSKARMKKRGYNQAELLAREMLRHLPKDTAVLDTKLLAKIVDTVPQAEIRKRSERLHNLGECFAVLPGRLAGGETVILIDDVITTGATLLAVRKALIQRGFREIRAITLAH